MYDDGSGDGGGNQRNSDCRNDRGSVSDSTWGGYDADRSTDGRADAGTHRYGDSRGDPDEHPFAYGDAGSYGHAETYGNTETDGYAEADEDADGHQHSETDCNAEADRDSR